MRKRRAELIAHGISVPDTIHSMKRRAPWHDYHGRGLYMITIVVEGRRPLLGAIYGSPKPHVELSPLGQHIRDNELPKMPHLYPNVEIWRAFIMPDHIHMIVHVKAPFRGNVHLSAVINGFKLGCRRAHQLLSQSPDAVLFESGYNDKILLNPNTLGAWKRYLADNPRRLWIKRSNPEYFTVIHNWKIGGIACQMVGNVFLLDVPDKEAVIFHRRYSKSELDALFGKYMVCGECGGVLVSAAIAPWERAVMREAMNRGYRLILLRDNGFPRLYKPAGEAFDACSRGQLLQISPYEYSMQRVPITRQKCLYLNRLAETIAYGGG